MMAGIVAFLVLAGLALLIFGLAWVGSWDRGPNPRHTLNASERARREGVNEVDRLAHRAAFLRSCEDGVCCCSYHGRMWCAVHDSEGEAVGGSA